VEIERRAASEGKGVGSVSPPQGSWKENSVVLLQPGMPFARLPQFIGLSLENQLTNYRAEDGCEWVSF
jgi:hypothetical protein